MNHASIDSKNDLNPLILFDDVCVLCSRFVKFILYVDRRKQFIFASLHSKVGHSQIARFGRSPEQLDSVAFIQNNTLHLRSDASLSILYELGGIWRLLARLGRLFPVTLADAIYNWVAANRYRIFGKMEACWVPDAVDRNRFIDL